MPYYKDLDLLFIHIPKTGGSFIADALNNKNYKVTLCQRGISIHNISNSLFESPHNKGSLQHQFYSTLYKYKNKININFEKIKVFSIVRNPYNKIMSDLFWLKLINKKSSPNEIYEKIKNNYLYRDDLDNHNQPQYKFITDENNQLIKNIKVFKCETLDILNHEINDFIGVNINLKNENANKDYSHYLNKNSIELINNFYKKDFELFDYHLYSLK